MVQVYFEVFYSLLLEDIFRVLKINHWLPLVTIGCLSNQSVHEDNKKIDVSVIF